MKTNEIFTLSKDEMTLVGDQGSVYHAQPSPDNSCAGCAFIEQTCFRPDVGDAYLLCSRIARKDGQSVVWVPANVAGASSSQVGGVREQDAPTTFGGAQ